MEKKSELLQRNKAQSRSERASRRVREREKRVEINKINNNRGVFLGVCWISLGKQKKIERGVGSKYKRALIKAFYAPDSWCWILKTQMGNEGGGLAGGKMKCV